MRFLKSAFVSLLLLSLAGCGKKGNDSASQAMRGVTNKQKLPAPAVFNSEPRQRSNQPDQKPASATLPTSDAELKQMTLADLEKLLQNDELDSQWFNRALHEMTRRKSREALDFIVRWATVAENKLPSALPPLDEMKAMERQRRVPVKGHWLLEFGKVTRATHYLAQSALPEGPQAAQGFVSRFKKKYGASEVGRKLSELLEMERTNGLGNIKLGSAPWQTDATMFPRD